MNNHGDRETSNDQDISLGKALRTIPRRFPHPLPLRNIGYWEANWYDNERSDPNSINFVLVLSSKTDKVRMRIDGRLVSPRPPFYKLTRPGMRTRYATPSPWEELYFCYGAALRPAFEKHGFELGTFAEFTITPRITRHIEEIKRLCQEVHVPGNADRLDRLAESLMVECVLSQTGNDGLDEKTMAICQIASYIELHFQDDIDIDSLVKRHGLSYRTFLRAWKARFGATPREHVIRLRIDAARETLSESSARIEEVAERLGYCDPLYFSRQFKRVTGLSPSQWRKNTRRA